MPFHMVDRIDEFERGVSIKARKLTSTGEDIWTQSTHGLEMRAGMVLESLLQTAGVLVVLSTDEPYSAALPASLASVSMMARVVPGDVLSLDVRFERFDDETAVFSGKVSLGEDPVLVLEGALFVLVPLGSLANPIDVLQRLSRMRRDLATASPGATTGARASLLEPS